MRSAPDSRAFLRSSLGDTSFGMQYINLKTASGYFSAISWCATLTTKSRYILKMDGDSRAPCRHPTRVSNIRPFPLMHAFVPVYGTRRIATICGHLRRISKIFHQRLTWYPVLRSLKVYNGYKQRCSCFTRCFEHLTQDEDSISGWSIGPETVLSWQEDEPLGLASSVDDHC